MTEFRGFFSLKTPRDLLRKLQRDLDYLLDSASTSQAAQYAAFDFFVTAEHMADWMAKDRGGPISGHRAYAHGALVSHIANGAKHFTVRPKRHKALRAHHISQSGFQDSAFQNNAFQIGQLVIEEKNGSMVLVVDVARAVLAHWQCVLGRESTDS